MFQRNQNVCVLHFARKHKSVRVYIFRKQITKSSQMIGQGGGGSLRSVVRDISPTPLLFDYKHVK